MKRLKIKFPNAPYFITSLISAFTVISVLTASAQTPSYNNDISRKSTSSENIESTENLPPIIFVTRYQYRSGHHNTETFFPSAEYEFNNGKFTPNSSLKILDPKTGNVQTLFETKTGVIRDPDVHWDGKRIIFSMRKNYADSYHIYELNITVNGKYVSADGEPKQLTFAKEVDDIDPFYLADDHIAFSSSREPKYCGCNRHIMMNLYRMEPDGANIHQISRNTLFDGHGSLLPDGRILYDRWEYVDRAFGEAQALWTCNPDGTNHAVYWGNNTPSPAGVIDARPIPNTDRTLCLFVACHDRPWGALAVIDRKLGLDGPKPVIYVLPSDVRKVILEPEESKEYSIDRVGAVVRQKIEDPFPLDENRFIYAKQIEAKNERTGIYLGIVDVAEKLLYKDAELGCFDPMPLRPRTRPPTLPARRNFTDKTGTFYVIDVYKGTDMQGVTRGEVKYLRIVESTTKKFWSNPPVAWLSTTVPAVNWDEFMNKRVIATVPVNEDGSAYFEVPAETFVYFQLLDKDGMMIQSMRSGTMVQPGEQAACIGCHEDRLTAASADLRTKIKVPHTFPQPLSHAASYKETVQPVWDKYCVGCHNADKPEGELLNLTGGTGQVFNISYGELWAKHYIRTLGGGPSRFFRAKTWGTRASRIFPYLTNEHHKVNLKEQDPDAFKKIAEWIDLNGPYYPDYATSFPNNPYARSPLTVAETRQLEKLTGRKILRPCDVRTDGVQFYADEPEQLNPRDAELLKIVTQINFDEPEKSPILQNIGSEQKDQALEIIRLGQERLTANGDNGLNGFRYCPVDAWREEKYQQTRRREAAFRQAIINGEKLYEKVPPPLTGF